MRRVSLSRSGSQDSVQTDSFSERSRFWSTVLASGVLVGILSVTFHVGLTLALYERERLTALAKPFGFAGALLLVTVCAVGVGLAVWMTGRFAPEAAGSGFSTHLDLRVEGPDQAIALVQPHLDHVVARLPELVRLVPDPLVVLFPGRLEGRAVGLFGGDGVVFPLLLDAGAVVVLVAAVLDEKAEANRGRGARANSEHRELRVGLELDLGFGRLRRQEQDEGEQGHVPQ